MRCSRWFLGVLLVGCSDRAAPDRGPGEDPAGGVGGAEAGPAPMGEGEGEGEGEDEGEGGAACLDGDLRPDGTCPPAGGGEGASPGGEGEGEGEGEGAGPVDDFNHEGSGAVGGDSGDGGGDPDPPGGVTAASCFDDIGGDLGPDYDQYGPTVAGHCAGTNHQDIEGVERLVFLGDSVTVGTPPWLVTDYYWVRLFESLKGRFGEDLEVQNCAQWGARTDDLLEGKREIADCFPDGGDSRKTLVVMTIGGNDIAHWASNQMGVDEAMAGAEMAAQYLDDALAWFREPDRFPAGVFVVVGNPYEYTDATGDVDSCPAAPFAGMEGNWIEGAPAVIHLHERYMEMAVRHQTDLVFILEAFCGHGYHHDDPESPCYRGPDAELWFDFTCIHPNPAGHAVIAEMFEAVVTE